MIASTSTSTVPFSTDVASGMVSSSSLCCCCCPRPGLRLQVPVDEVDLLQAAKALPDLLRAQLSDALDRLQLVGCGGQHHVEASKLAHHALDRHLRKARDVAEDAISARRDREVRSEERRVGKECR